MYKFSDELTREIATYNWPCEKQIVRRSIPAAFKVYPWDLFIVIAKQIRTGNWTRLNKYMRKHVFVTMTGQSLDMLFISFIKYAFAFHDIDF